MKKIEIYQTEDGRTFDNEKDAKAYEERVLNKDSEKDKEKNDLIDKYKELVEMFREYTSKSLTETEHPYSDVFDNMNNLFDTCGFDSDPCRNCMNNPKINKYSSGICHCILGNRVVYY